MVTKSESTLQVVVTPDALGAYVKASGALLLGSSSHPRLWAPAVAMAAGRVLTLDLCDVARIDAAGIGALVSLKRQLAKEKGELRLASASSRVRRALELTGLDRVLAGESRGERTPRIPCEPLPARYYQRRLSLAAAQGSMLQVRGVA